MENTVKSNVHTLLEEIQWLKEVLVKRLKQHLNLEGSPQDFTFIKDLPPQSSKFNLPGNLKAEERLLLAMALVPHIQPDFYDSVIQEHLPQAGDFPQLGGVRGKQFRGFLPTGETALFKFVLNDRHLGFDVLPFAGGRNRAAIKNVDGFADRRDFGFGIVGPQRLKSGPQKSRYGQQCQVHTQHGNPQIKGKVGC
jgi:hypothetical protein